MSTASNTREMSDFTQVVEMTVRACQLARQSAEAAQQAIRDHSVEALDHVKDREEELDSVDRETNETVTAAITQVSSPENARELLACLKIVIELERIGDLLLSFANRFRSCAERLHPQDSDDLASMASILERMLYEAGQGFSDRDTRHALTVLRSDAELDRIRNLVVVRHIENPQCVQQQESFHVVFMAQAFERAGDHAKNVAEELVQLVTGRSVRHLLRSYDKPVENMFVDYMRKKEAQKG